MPYDAVDTTGVEHYNLPDFVFASGLKKEIQIAYRVFNDDGATKGTVLIPTCYSGFINTTQNFIDGALKEYRVIVTAMIGAGESTSPSNDKDFPSDYSLHYKDCINSQYALLTKKFGVKSLDAVIGFSMGGQQAYHWAAMHGTGSDPFVKRAVAICGSAKTSGLNAAFLEGVTSTLFHSSDYDAGRYRQNGVKPLEGLRAYARSYKPWLTSAEWYRQELWRKTGASTLQEWIHPPVGKGSYEDHDAEDLLVLARMWQNGDISTTHSGSSVEEVLKKISIPMLLMPCMTDQYFDHVDSENEMKSLQHGKYEPIPSVWGHMAGGGANPEDLQWMDKKIAEFMAA